MSSPPPSSSDDNPVVSVPKQPVLSPKSSDKVLAPKQSPPVSSPVTQPSVAIANNNVTATSSDIHSLVSSGNEQNVPRQANLLNVSAHSFVSMFAEAMTTIINDVKELPRILHHHHQSSNGTMSSVPVSTGLETPDSHHSPSPDNNPAPSAPPLAYSMNTDPSKNNLPSTRQVFAKGPPSDPVVFEAQNFAARKSFHFAQPPAYEEAGALDTSGLRKSTHVPRASSQRPSSVPDSFSHGPDPSFRSQAFASEHVTNATNSHHLPEEPILAPNMAFMEPQSHSSRKFVPPSPKPMISFDVAKWAREIKDVTIKNKSYDDVVAWYDTIQQAMLIATSSGYLMPDIEELTTDFDFAKHILPPQISSVFKAGYDHYVSMAKALRLHITKPETIKESCTNLIVQRDLHKHNKDGFVLLLKILCKVFPHLGGPQINVVKEIGTIRPSKNETFDSLLYKFVVLNRKLQLSGHRLPATLLFEQYLSIIKGNRDVYSLVSPIYRSFYLHVRRYGPDVEFMEYDIPEVHDYLIVSGIDTTSQIYTPQVPPKPTFAQTHSASLLIPQANAASYSDFKYEEQGPPEVPFSPQANAAAMALGRQPSPRGRTRVPPCPVCFQRHPVNHCWVRGPKYQPVWLQRNFAKYKALHKDDDSVEEAYKNQPPPLRHASISAQANKSVCFAQPSYNDLRPLPPPPVVPVNQQDDEHRSLVLHNKSPDETSSFSYQEMHDSVTRPECRMAKDDLPNYFNEEDSFIEA